MPPRICRYRAAPRRCSKKRAAAPRAGSAPSALFPEPHGVPDHRLARSPRCRPRRRASSRPRGLRFSAAKRRGFCARCGLRAFLSGLPRLYLPASPASPIPAFRYEGPERFVRMGAVAVSARGCAFFRPRALVDGLGRRVFPRHVLDAAGEVFFRGAPRGVRPGSRLAVAASTAGRRWP